MATASGSPDGHEAAGGDMQREGAPVEIPWAVVESVGVGVGGYSRNVVSVELAAGYEPPTFRGDGRVRWRPDKRVLTLLAVGFRNGVDVSAFGRDIAIHWQGATARALLASPDASGTTGDFAGVAFGADEFFVEVEG